MRLEGKIGLVTAAASGMGRAGAERFAREGAAVGVADVDADGVAAVVQAITAAGGRAKGIVADLRQDEEAKRIVRETSDEFGGLDFVWNHVGHPGPASIEGIDMSDFELAMDLNIRSVLATSEAAIPELRLRGGGSILFTASTSGLVGNVGQANYAAAKLGIMGLSKSIALDMARFRVRSNCISPFAWSRMIGSIPTNTPEAAERVEKLKQMTPEKIAPMAVYLCSHAADEANVSGQIFGVRNNEIFLFSQPRPLRAVQRSDGWTPEAIAEQAIPAFEASMYPLEVSADVFSWDPV